MSQSRNGRASRTDSADFGRPLTARSIIGSLLLGVDPPRLSGRSLVKGGRFFGIEEGTIRVALSRMVTAGELETKDGRYQLAGRLLERQRRQTTSRSPRRRRWSGAWIMAVVPSGRRDADSRLALRTAATALLFAELRDGVWLRPDNLNPKRLPETAAELSGQCRLFKTRPDNPEELVRELWDLDTWAETAESMRKEMTPFADRLGAGDTEALAPGFQLAATVVRHMNTDPLLPDALLPEDWPGPALREDLDRYQEAWKTVWFDFFRRTDPH